MTPRFRVGDRVVLNFHRARHATCPECGARWVVVGCEPHCPECGHEGLLGERVRLKDLGVDRPDKC